MTPGGFSAPPRLIAIALAQAATAIAAALLANGLFTPDGSTPIWTGLGLAGAMAVSVWLRFRERVDGEAFGQRMAHEVRLRLADHMLRMAPKERGLGEGDIVLRFVGDLAAIRNWHARGVGGALISAPMLVGGTAALIWLDWRIGLAVTACLTLSGCTQALAAPHLHAAGVHARRERARLARTITETAAILPSVQLFGQSASAGRRVARRSAALALAMRRRAVWSGLLHLGADIGAAGLPAAVLLLWALDQHTGTGSASAALLLGGLLGPRIREIGRIREYWELAAISRERIDAFLARPTLDQRSDAKRLHRREGRLALRNLALAGVFEKVSAEAPAGARVALVGQNGAGKSRLLGLIAGLETPTSGRVVIDGQNASMRRLSSLRRIVALASMDAPLARGDLDQNIHYGARANGADAERMLKLGGHAALVAEFAAGGATRIGPAGAGISAGQRARIILLRALMRMPKVLLLDEIEAHMDEAGRSTLSRVLAEFPGTIVMATHSGEWQARCTQTWRIEAGMLTVTPLTSDIGREVVDHA